MHTKYPAESVMTERERALAHALLRIANHSCDVSGAPDMVRIATEALVNAGVVNPSLERNMGELLPA